MELKDMPSKGHEFSWLCKTSWIKKPNGKKDEEILWFCQEKRSIQVNGKWEKFIGCSHIQNVILQYKNIHPHCDYCKKHVEGHNHCISCLISVQFSDNNDYKGYLCLECEEMLKQKYNKCYCKDNYKCGCH